jgi:hypothetical protein
MARIQQFLSHDIHRLDERSADEGKNKGEVFKMSCDGPDKTAGGDEKQ